MRTAFKRVPSELMTSELMTVEQVAAYLQLHKLTVYKFIRSGELQALRLGRSVRVRRADVDEFLEAHKVASPRRGRAVRPEVGDHRPARAAVRPQEAERRPVSAADAGEPADLREERRRRREALIASNPLEWVVRGLH